MSEPVTVAIDDEKNCEFVGQRGDLDAIVRAVKEASRARPTRWGACA